MTKPNLNALDLMVIADTLTRTLSIVGFENALGGYTKEARESVSNKVQDILSTMELSVENGEKVVEEQLATKKGNIKTLVEESVKWSEKNGNVRASYDSSSPFAPGTK